MEAEQRGIQIYVDEDDDDTTARAVLSTGDDAHVVGVGRARRDPTDLSPRSARSWRSPGHWPT